MHKHRMPLVSDLDVNNMNQLMAAAEQAKIPLLLYVSGEVGESAQAYEAGGAADTKRRNLDEVVNAAAKQFQGRCLVARVRNLDDPAAKFIVETLDLQEPLPVVLRRREIPHFALHRRNIIPGVLRGVRNISEAP